VRYTGYLNRGEILQRDSVVTSVIHEPNNIAELSYGISGMRRCSPKRKALAPTGLVRRDWPITKANGGPDPAERATPGIPFAVNLRGRPEIGISNLPSSCILPRPCADIRPTSPTMGARSRTQIAPNCDGSMIVRAEVGVIGRDQNEVAAEVVLLAHGPHGLS
jgi:hypothetical protein